MSVALQNVDDDLMNDSKIRLALQLRKAWSLNNYGGVFGFAEFLGKCKLELSNFSHIF